ncbi:MAG: hypothetical protein GFH27_549415n54 [Chloroflexi bacterium AL-W]|nr:hypothetical protein [Chloroflexi bacterium AL-N1]NOK71502.1 hypothetical protein [Chloroflexi bacterium AL-N10]NOK77283.1 hypothetical protein [Chloroflexi bacterium AL-N5]NOK86323.1 hypothetical protein [Chloroflexi bacterium AL-W]NOK93293.1 hypothetical protein [Chloroflexi bacterium AL-N15]
MFMNTSQHSWIFPIILSFLSIILSLTVLLGVFGITQGYAAFEYRSSPVYDVPMPTNLI